MIAIYQFRINLNMILNSVQMCILNEMDCSNECFLVNETPFRNKRELVFTAEFNDVSYR